MLVDRQENHNKMSAVRISEKKVMTTVSEYPGFGILVLCWMFMCEGTGAGSGYALLLWLVLPLISMCWNMDWLVQGNSLRAMIYDSVYSTNSYICCCYCSCCCHCCSDWMKQHDDLENYMMKTWEVALSMCWYGDLIIQCELCRIYEERSYTYRIMGFVNLNSRDSLAINGTPHAQVLLGLSLNGACSRHVEVRNVYKMLFGKL
jgi:hypothetical protein